MAGAASEGCWVMRARRVQAHLARRLQDSGLTREEYNGACSLLRGALQGVPLDIALRDPDWVWLESALRSPIRACWALQGRGVLGGRSPFPLPQSQLAQNLARLALQERRMWNKALQADVTQAKVGG